MFFHLQVNSHKACRVSVYGSGLPFKKRVLLALAALLVFSPSKRMELFALESLSPYEPVAVYTILEKWIDAEAALALWYQGVENLSESSIRDSDRVLIVLDDLAAALDRFVQEDRYHAYYTTSFSHEAIVNKIQDLGESLAAAVRLGRADLAREQASTMRKAIIDWQRYDEELLNRIQLSYFYHLIGFSVFIMLMVFVLWRLSRALWHSREKERQSAAFFREIVLAQERERSRISRELHDTVAQDLRYQGLRLSGISRKTDAGDTQKICQEILADQQNIINRLKDLCNGLLPPDLHNLGLPDVLRRLGAEFAKQTGIECRVSVEEKLSIQPLSEEMQLQCFRLVQESLTNIGKHAHASEAVVVMRNASLAGHKNTKTLLICVSDDGRGFEQTSFEKNIPLQGDETGLGIPGMYERIAILGGSLSFVSAPGEGVMVRIEIPLKPR
jgi:signal transduction histidine kinase